MHSSDTDTRKYTKLASIPKHRLNIHEDRINESKEARVIKITFEQTEALKKLLRELSISISPNSDSSENPEEFKRIEGIEVLSR